MLVLSKKHLLWFDVVRYTDSNDTCFLLVIMILKDVLTCAAQNICTIFALINEYLDES